MKSSRRRGHMKLISRGGHPFKSFEWRIFVFSFTKIITSIVHNRSKAYKWVGRVGRHVLKRLIRCLSAWVSSTFEKTNEFESHDLRQRMKRAATKKKMEFICIFQAKTVQYF